MDLQKLRKFVQKDSADRAKLDPKRLKKFAKADAGEEPDGDEEGGEADVHHAEPDGDEPESDEALAAEVAARMESGDRDDELDALMEGYDPEADGNPPEWVADEETWERAKTAVQKNWDAYEDGWAVTAYVYDRMGGERK